MNDKLTFDVVGALVKKGNKFLVCQRYEKDHFGALWEFPGGKVEENEDKISALKREIEEELDVEIEIKGLVNIFEDEIPDMKIIVYLYDAIIVKGAPRCRECQDLKWASLAEIKSLPLAPADKKIFMFLSKGVR